MSVCLQESSAGVFMLTHFGSSVKAGFSGRAFSADKRGIFLTQMGMPASQLRRAKQVHGTEIIDPASFHGATETIEADGLITSCPGLVLGILTADCVPAFFFDPVRRVIGLAHAGWKGLHQGILEKMVQLFIHSHGSNPSSLQIVLGPSIRACCYEVNKEFCGYFPHTTQEKGNGYVTDLTAEAKRRLRQSGVSLSGILDLELCTSCRNDQFFSARREKTSERVLSVIQLS